MGNSVVKRRIPALLLCVAMIVGMMSQWSSAVMKAAPTEITGVEPGTIETISVPVKETVIKETAGTVSKSAELRSGRISIRETDQINADRGLYYNLGITPRTAGTVLEDWNSGTRILKLTAVPYAGCSFICWTEYYYDEELGEEAERLIQDSDPFNPVYSWYVAESGRTLVANFRKGGEYFIWNASSHSEKGELTVSPNLESVRPGTEITVTGTAFKNYEVVGIEFGYAVEEGYLGSENVEWERISDTDTATFRMPSSDVWVRAVFRSTLPHTVRLVNDDEHGTITFEDGSTTKQIVAGTSVTLNVTPDQYYRLDTIIGIPEGYDVRTHTFEMPDMDLEIHGTFTQLKTYEISFNLTPSGDYGSIMPAYNQDTGLLVVAAIPTNTSILFLGWYDENGTLLSDEQIYAFYPDRSMTIEVRFAQGYTIYKANMNHGTFEVYPERVPQFSTDTKSYYQPGETVRLIATPDDGYMLKCYFYVYYSDYEAYQNGQADLRHTLEGDTITMINDSVIVMAAFVVGYDINTSVNIEEAGVALGSGKYEQGAPVTLTAEANEGYEFVNWTENGTVVGTSATMSFYANSNRDLVANFRKLINVTVTSSDESYGTVSGGGAYSPGSRVTVTATPTGDNVFVNWTKNGAEVSTSAEYTFTAEEDVELVANFRQLNNYTVDVVSSNSEYGTVSGGGTVKEGNSVTVIATPLTDCYFVNWTKNGAEVSTSAEYTFTPDGNVTLTAYFEHVQEYTVTVTSSNTAYGTVSGGGKFNTGESVTVTATPLTDCVFVNWTKDGAEVSTSAEYTFTVQGNVELVANFRTLNYYTVTVSSSNESYGTVSGGGSYKEGSSVTVTATPLTDCVFVNWTKNGEEVSTSAEYTFTVEADTELVAVFKEVDKLSVTVQSSNDSYGTVSGGGTFTKGSYVTVTATPLNDSVFVNWTVNGQTVSASESYTFKVENDVTLVANFKHTAVYVISNEAELRAFSAAVNNGETDACAIMTADIIMSDENWIPIGDGDKKYSGTFDGQGHSIVGLKCTGGNLIISYNFYMYYAALFGCVGYGGCVKNVTLIDCDIQSHDPYGWVVNVAGIVGMLSDGIISNCHVNGTNNLCATGECVYVGGIAGRISNNYDKKGIIEFCSVTGNTTIKCNTEDDAHEDSDTYAGGIVGCIRSGYVRQCYRDDEGIVSAGANHIRVGGVFGSLDYYGDGSVTDCYSIGDVSAISDADTVNIGGVGGVCGSDLKNCYSIGKISGAKENAGELAADIGGVIGYTERGTISDCFYSVDDNPDLNAIGENDDNGCNVNESTVLGLTDAEFTELLENSDLPEDVWVQGIRSPLLKAFEPYYSLTLYANDGTETKKTFKFNKFIRSEFTYLINPFESAELIFTGWNTKADGSGMALSEMNELTGDIELYAQWRAVKYGITFVNDDGTVLQSTDVAYGETPVYTGEAPTKDADARYTYTFAGWTPEIAEVTGEATYTATYTATVNEYTIQFVDEDGTVLQSTNVAYGETPVYTGATPAKAADAQYTYTFAGWTPEITKVTGEATYTATYSGTVNKYSVTFVNEDGTVLQSTETAYGDTPEYTGETPTKAADAQYTYTFAGWRPEVSSVTGDVTYTAAYEATVNTYEITFSVNGVTETVTAAYGDTVAAPADPAVDGFDFTGWFTDEGCTSAADLTQPVTGSAVFYAGFEEIVYTVEGDSVWDAGNARDLTFTVHRSRKDGETFGLFKGLFFNGAEVDPSYYTAENGSLRLTVKNALFENKPGGTYDLVIQFADGAVTTEITIYRKTVNPPTGESLQLAVCAALALSAPVLAAVTAKRIRRKKEER